MAAAMASSSVRCVGGNAILQTKLLERSGDASASAADSSGLASLFARQRHHAPQYHHSVARKSQCALIKDLKAGETTRVLFGRDNGKKDKDKEEEKKKKPSKKNLHIRALDAAQPFDYESIALTRLQEKRKMKIGIVGFGKFGQFLCKRILQHNHDVLAYSRSDYSAIAREMGVSYFRDADDFCEEHPEVVVICTSILSTERVLSGLPLQRLRRSTLFVDMLSVKEFPKMLFLQTLPPEFDILCTHPMFGPESGKGSWKDLPLVYEKVRVRDGRIRKERIESFLHIFEKEGCRMVEMSCEEHDRNAASSQFITHTVGRVLGKFALESTPINTKGYETLLNLVENTQGDSFDLYYGLFMYNINATEELQRLERAFDSVKKQLFDQLHSILRDQVFGSNGRHNEESVDVQNASGSGSDEVIEVPPKATGLTLAHDDPPHHATRSGPVSVRGTKSSISGSATELIEVIEVESLVSEFSEHDDDPVRSRVPDNGTSVAHPD